MVSKRANIDELDLMIANARNVRDYAKAYDYAKKTVRNGYYEGYYTLGQLLYYGTGCEQNRIRAMKYLELFIQKMNKKDYANEEALADTYLMLTKGYYELKDYHKALIHYHNLQLADPELAFSLGEFEADIKAIYKETTFKILKNIVTVATCILMGFFIVTHYKQDFLEYINRPTQHRASAVKDEGVEKKTSKMYSFDDVRTPTAASVEDSDFVLMTNKQFNVLELKEITCSKAWASSEYISSIGVDYSANCIIDNNEATQWQEGANGSGIGEVIHFDFSKKVLIRGIIFLNGKMVSKNDYYNNNRVAAFSIGKDEKLSIRLDDKFEKQYIYLNKPIEADSIDIIIDGVYAGKLYDDTCITDIQFFE